MQYRNGLVGFTPLEEFKANPASATAALQMMYVCDVIRLPVSLA